MKKTTNKMLGLVVVLMMAVVLLSGCESNGIEGKTWKYTQDMGSYYLMSFSKGTCTSTYVNLISGNQETETYSYSISGNKITMNGQTDTWKISGNTLLITENGETIAFERQ